MKTKIKGTEIIISDNNNQYHVRTSNRYVGVQSPRNNKKVAEAAEALGGEWKPGAQMWAVKWDKAEEIVMALVKIKILGHTLTIDEDVAYEIGLID